MDLHTCAAPVVQCVEKGLLPVCTSVSHGHVSFPALPFLKNTVILLYPFAPLMVLYGLSLALGWNFTHTLCSFYKYRVK
jgi:hypothetical protein